MFSTVHALLKASTFTVRIIMSLPYSELTCITQTAVFYTWPVVRIHVVWHFDNEIARVLKWPGREAIKKSAVLEKRFYNFQVKSN